MQGPWTDLQIRPDLSGFLDLALSDPEALLNLLPDGLAKDLLPDGINLLANVREKRAQAEQLAVQRAQQVARQAEAALQEQAQRLADQAAQSAANVRADIEARARAEAQRLEALAQERLRGLQGDVGQQVEDAVGGLLQGLFN